VNWMRRAEVLDVSHKRMDGIEASILSEFQ
jgi:hypothetical protein